MVKLQVRVCKYDREKDRYFLVGYADFLDYSEVFKLLHYMKENEIPLEINTTDIADCPDEEHYIEDISFVMPNSNGIISPYIAVYLDD